MCLEYLSACLTDTIKSLIYNQNLILNTSHVIIMNMTFLLLSVLLSLFAHAQILAIDYGTMYIKAALVHTGAGKSFSIVENPKSNRKFINSMGIYNQERFYEADTLTKRSRGPANCFIYSKVLIDMHQNPDKLERIKKELILEYIQHPESDQLMGEFILSNMPKGAQSMSLLQGVAMMLKYVKHQAQKQAKGTLKDVVLTVPSHWSLRQRQFMIDAATMADMYVLSLIHENTAAAINYALSQRSTNNTQKILFFNLGANTLQMTLAEFRPVKTDKTKSIETVFILDHYGRSYMGGLSLDYLIADFFAKKFETKYKKTLDQRGRIRLLAESEKTKNVLSANKEATLFIEGIMDGIDFSSTIYRRDLDALGEDIFQELVKPIKRFLFDNDLKAQELTAVELIGGGSRVPRLQTIIGQIVGNASMVGSHINGDEAMVFGAAFYGANSSKKFKIKGINLYDGFNFDIRIVLRNGDSGIQEGDEGYYFKNTTLFKKKSRFGLTKEVTFKCRQNLIIDLYKEDENGVQLINSHKINSIKNINESSFKVSLTFEINPVEIVKFNEAKYVYSKDVVQSYTEKVRKAVPVDKSKVDDSEKQSEEEDKQDSSEEKKEDEDDEQPKEGDQQVKNKTKSQKKKKKEKKIEYQTVERTRNVTKNFQQQLSFKQTFTINIVQDQQIASKGRKIMGIFQTKETIKKRLSESKNKLQALIYQVRDKIEQEQFFKYSQTKEKNKLEVLVQEKGTWLDDTYSSDPEEYIKEFKELNEPVEKIKKRIVEHRERDEVKKRALGIIEDYAKQISKIRKGKAWITEEEVQNLVQDFKDAKSKVGRVYSSLQESPLNQDSVHRNKDMLKEADIAKDKFFVLKAKSKPKGWKEQKKQDKQASQSDKQKSQNKKQEDVNEDEL